MADEKNLILTFGSVETYAEEDGNRMVRGQAMRYGMTSEEKYGIRWRVKAGAFKDSIEKDGPAGRDRIKLFFGHNVDELPIGKITELRDTSTGLTFAAVFATTQQALEISSLVNDKILKEISIGLRISDYEFDEKKHIRTVLACELREVSIVNYALFPALTIAASATETSEPYEPTTLAAARELAKILRR